MQDLPHHYRVSARSATGQSVMLHTEGVAQLETDAPAEFGGPGDLWSPETLFAGAVANCLILSFRAVANCLILSFRAVAKASKLDWLRLDCSVEAILDRVERVTRFTEIRIQARLVVASDTDTDKAGKLLDKAKQICLITNSLTATVILEKEVYNEN